MHIRKYLEQVSKIVMGFWKQKSIKNEINRIIYM
jgi:hypothetical protein